MSLDRDELVARDRRIRAEARQRTAQPARSAEPSPGRSWIPVVLRSVDVATGEMYFHRLDYSTDPPEVGAYKTFGNLERCYPLPTAVYADYEPFVWPEFVEGSDPPQEYPVTTLTIPMMALKHRGHWIVQIPLKGLAGLLDLSLPISGCGHG